MRPIDFGTARTIARDRGTCALCGRGFRTGADILATFSRHALGRVVVHAMAHVQCPVHLRVVRPSEAA